MLRPAARTSTNGEPSARRTGKRRERLNQISVARQRPVRAAGLNDARPVPNARSREIALVREDLKLDVYDQQLASLAQDCRLRRLESQHGLDFCSNDYLAFASDPQLARAVAAALAAGVPLGSGGSRLLRGNRIEHESLEAKAAAFFRSEAALYFSSGFMANSALYSTLPQAHDLVIADELVHASIHEGLRRSRASFRFARHNDLNSFHEIAHNWRSNGNAGAIWIGVESLYSMDGDFAPLPELASLAGELDSWLVVDEAHATGIYGPEGRGLSADVSAAGRLIALHSCSKALGVQGALLCVPMRIKEFLVNRARGFIFSTAPSPLICVAAEAAIDGAAAADDRRSRLAELRTETATALERNLGISPSPSHILPFIVGGDRPAMELAAELRSRGFDVRGIRPPTVPPGTSRLRIALTLNVTVADALALVASLEELVQGSAR